MSDSRIVLWDSNFPFSTRTMNCLRNEGIDTLGKLTRLTEKEILCWPNMGQKSVDEIKAILAANDLCLADHPADRLEQDISDINRRVRLIYGGVQVIHDLMTQKVKR